MSTESDNGEIRQDGAEPVYGPAYSDSHSVPRREASKENRQGFASLSDDPSPADRAPYPPYPSDDSNARYISRDMASGLAYFVAPAIYFLLAEPYRSSKQVRFHSWQAIFFFIAAAAAREVEQLLVAMLPSPVAFTIVSLMLLAFFTGWLIAMVKAFQGGKFTLPLVGRFADQTASTSSSRDYS